MKHNKKNDSVFPWLVSHLRCLDNIKNIFYTSVAKVILSEKGLNIESKTTKYHNIQGVQLMYIILTR